MYKEKNDKKTDEDSLQSRRLFMMNGLAFPNLSVALDHKFGRG